MISSIFLAKVIGIYLIVDGLIGVTRKDEVIPMFDEVKNSRISVLFFGIVVLILGLLITTAHNVWSGAAFQVAITLIGWLLVVKGLVLTLMPAQFSINLISSFNKPAFYVIGGSVAALIGVWLTLSGFIL